MAVPSSGQLNMLKLAREKHHDNYDSTANIIAPISFYDLVVGGNDNGSGQNYDLTNTSSSSYPDTTIPHKMSEWYSYEHVSVDFSSSMSVGGATINLQSFLGYNNVGSNTFGSMTNSTFDGSNIEFFYWTDGNGGEVRFKTQSQKYWTSMTIGTTSFPSSTSWSFDPFDNYWSYSTSTNPFGSNGSTTTITANY